MIGKSPSRIASRWALTAVALMASAALLAALRLRLSAAERGFAWPWTAAAPALEPVLAVAAAAAIVAAALAWAGHRDPRWRRTLVEALLWPAIPLAAAWLIMPASGPPTPAAGLAMLAAGLAGWWLYRTERGRGPDSVRGDTGFPRPIWIWLHGLAVGILVASGLLGDGFEDPAAFVLSLALYPAYALVQLFLVLAVAWPRLRRLAGGATAGPVACLAWLFALVHWPNPALMALTGGGMVFWAAAYGRGRNLLVLALSMGLLASLVAQGLPNAWTDHMRAGPRYVRMRAVPALAASADQQTRRLPAGEVRTTAYLADLYPAVVGRAATGDELARWWRSIAPCRRGVVAWRFYISDEYRRRFGEPAGETPLPGDVHWTRLPEPWPARIGAFTGEPDGATPPAWDAFVAHLYREILGREATAGELAAWDQQLSSRQNQRLVEVLLDLRRELAAAEFDTCSCARLGLHH